VSAFTVRDAEGGADDSDTPASAPLLRRCNLFATLLTLVPSAKSGAEAERLIQGLATCARSLSQHAAMCFENAAKVGEGAPPTGKADAAARRLREYAAEWSGFECAHGERLTDLRSRLRRHAFDRQRNEGKHANFLQLSRRIRYRTFRHSLSPAPSRSPAKFS
jgi:hypothetical protein